MAEMKRIIQLDKSVIVAADVTKEKFPMLMDGVAGVPGIGGIKLGFQLGLESLSNMAQIARDAYGSDVMTSAIMYDHQKAGNDIPDIGQNFANTLLKAGINAAIIFPFAGPATQESWTKRLQDTGIEVITGGLMTHKQFLISEGGYIDDNAPERIFRLACKLGVRHFVVPGTKIEWVIRMRKWLVEELGEGNFILYAPGFISQGGDITECGKAAGKLFHAIVGSAIYKKPTAEEIRQAAVTVTSQLLKAA